MKNRFFIIICIAFTLFFTSSCVVPEIYMPTPQHVPLFAQKGEVEASEELGIPLLNFHGAYAATNHLFVIGDASFSPSVLFFYPSRFNVGEFGCGYYTVSRDFLRFEMQGGYGFGNRYGYGEIFSGGFFTPLYHTSYTVNTNYAYWYIQPAAGWVSRQWEYGISSRFSYMSFPGFNY